MIKLVSTMNYHVNICNTSIIFCYNNRSGIGAEWEENGSGMGAGGLMMGT